MNPTVPDRLFTWIDVEAHLSALAAARLWPPWLLEADAFWDGVELTVRPGTPRPGVIGWLESVFGQNSVRADGLGLVLDSAPTETNERTLRIVLTEQEAVDDARRVPRLHERRVVASLGEPLPRPDSPEFVNDVQIVAFHSFKGGAGRTLQAVALADAIAGAGSPVLLVDADLEAPGITWMYEAQGRRTDVAYDDFLALLQGSEDGSSHVAVSIASAYLPNQQFGNAYVLPATRKSAIPHPPWIVPADLLTPERSRYFLTESLAELANSLRVRVVILDLRAGISELDTPILLDPRVRRVFVTTLSDQSVRGISLFIREVGRLAPTTRDSDPPSAVVITQINEREHALRAAEAASALRDSLATTLQPVSLDSGDDATVDADVVARPILIPFDSKLLALPASWDSVVKLTRDVGLANYTQNIVSDLISSREADADSVGRQPDADVLQQQRKALESTARSLIYAETASSGDFLVTESLRRLVSSHRTEPPIAVSVGAKGSGKTFTFIQMCLRSTWGGFGAAAGIEGVTVQAPMAPVLMSVNLSSGLADAINETRLKAIGPNGALTNQLQVRELITNRLAGPEMSDSEWRKVWLTALAAAAGLTTSPESVENQLGAIAAERSLVFLIDGLEDLLQDFTTNERQQQALRVLLTDVLDWLRALRGKRLGAVVFVRRDLVQWAVRQNTRQFLARYGEYELQWNAEEALRLALWVCTKAGAIDAEANVVTATDTELASYLVRLWGEKMGGPRSREARSDQWFLAALSDFNQQIQARDIVSFLAEAAKLSVGDNRWPARLLTPAAMRTALLECSRGKIAAIRDENPRVGELLTRLEALPAERKRIPFDAETFGLSAEDLDILGANGVIFREEDQYWIPEIYRHGLGMRALGRPRILAVANLVRLRNNLD